MNVLVLRWLALHHNLSAVWKVRCLALHHNLSSLVGPVRTVLTGPWLGNNSVMTALVLRWLALQHSLWGSAESTDSTLLSIKVDSHFASGFSG